MRAVSTFLCQSHKHISHNVEPYKWSLQQLVILICLSQPGKETASQHRWECRGGRRVGWGQCRWDGGRLQADERRCMYSNCSFFYSISLFISSIPQSSRQALSLGVQHLKCGLCLCFLFLLNWENRLLLSTVVFVGLCSSCLLLSLLFSLCLRLCLSVWLRVLILLLFSLLLFVSPLLHLFNVACFFSKWKVLYEIAHSQSLILPVIF